MKNLLLSLVTLVLLASCGSAKRTYKPVSASTADRIVNQAQSFAGTPYKWGGTSRSGMDCSGLIYTAFNEENIVLPRVSRDMATKGKPVKKSAIKKGDLVFFKTNKSSKKINHVGLVTAVKDDRIYFIHSTTSRGVLTSTLEEKYWKNAYSQARRVL
jgi:cell wall-associated NlpC family hydrolase